MRVLGIETSCDETAVAIVDGDRNILAQALVSQTEDHKPYGGVVPEIAARSHLQHINHQYGLAMKTANLTLSDMDAIAVTAGPGLIGGVIVGVMFAKALASVARRPLIAVNHLEGHALTARLTDNVRFPFALLLVSGGHCQMLEVLDVGSYRLIGQTKDDALGEAFDKTGKMLGLAYPAGPEMERRAKLGDKMRFKLPRPMIKTPGCDMSFSGLKTAVRLEIEKITPMRELDEQDRNDMAASFEMAICDIMSDRLAAALFMLQDRPLTCCVVAGGVAANQALKAALSRVAALHNLALITPPIALCTDNAAMIAWAGLERFSHNKISAMNCAPQARWPLCS